MDPYGRKKRYGMRFVVAGIVLVICTGILIIQFFRSPSDFPVGTIVTIPSGVGISGAGNILKKEGVIRSVFMYKVYTMLIQHGAGIKAGQYLFDAPQSVLKVAYRIGNGIEGLSKIKVTVPEGSNSKDVSVILGKAVTGIDTKTLLLLAKAQEGYLFPDTYFFYQNTTPQQVVDAMRANFDVQIVALASSTKSFLGKNKVTQKQIVTMASIIEKEATSTVDRQIIAGILWKRYADTYPLQVDAPFFYFLNKTSSKVTNADLAVSSPYNLYKNVGLPPTPISNPGIDALFAVVNPTTTKYWYYLSDEKGNIHYAVTYDQHLVNKAKWVD